MNDAVSPRENDLNVRHKGYLPTPSETRMTGIGEKSMR